jgi:hypothetical protein
MTRIDRRNTDLSWLEWRCGRGPGRQRHRGHRPVVNSYLSESHAPFNWLTIYRLGNAIQLEDVGPRRNPEMQCDIFGSSDHADAFRSPPKRDAITPSKLDDVRNVAAIGAQTRKSVQHQDDLFKRDRASRSVIQDALHSQNAPLGRAQCQFRPLNEVRSCGGLCNHNTRHEILPRRRSSPSAAVHSQIRNTRSAAPNRARPMLSDLC